MVCTVAEMVIIGGGGHARVIAQLLRRLGHSAGGYVAPSDEGPLAGLPWLGPDAALRDPQPGMPRQAVLGIGKLVPRSHRVTLMVQMLGWGIQFPALCASTACVHDDVMLDAGTVVLDGAVVVTGSRLGRGCIINTHAAVDHDCRLGDDVHIAPGAVLSGGVTIEDGSMVGTGACIVQGVRVCADVMIGAGATVARDITTPGTYVGTPARRLA